MNTVLVTSIRRDASGNVDQAATLEVYEGALRKDAVEQLTTFEANLAKNQVAALANFEKDLGEYQATRGTWDPLAREALIGFFAKHRETVPGPIAKSTVVQYVSQTLVQSRGMSINETKFVASMVEAFLDDHAGDRGDTSKLFTVSKGRGGGCSINWAVAEA